MSPPSNAFIQEEDLQAMEPFFPLHVLVCADCYLVQLPMVQSPEELFTEDYAYFSSFSDAWLHHAKEYCHRMIERFGLDTNSQVIEIGSNDGYLLRNFKEKDIPVLGVEPSGNVADAAISLGIPTIKRFFGTSTAEALRAEGKAADLLLGNNVLAHVPDISDFISGIKILLKQRGVITMEFPHLMRLMEHNQFDTIYHEHYSYLSFTTVQRMFAEHGLPLFDVEELWTHGGSLRIYARHAENKNVPISVEVTKLLERETQKGFTTLDHYLHFSEKVHATKRKLLDFLIQAKDDGKRIAGYGAPAKGNTLLNYCGIRTDLIDFIVDRSPQKQGRYTPGTRIPIRPPEAIRETRPDFLLILPWNLKEEIMNQMAYIREWGGQFVVPIPEVRVLP
jgi:hypothetical protein